MKAQILTSFMVATACTISYAQNTFEVPTTNTRATVQQRIAATDIKVMYNRPNMKGRKIFGDLVPFEQVWRTGSDASTKISFSTPVLLNNQELDSGDYEIFTIPGQKEWTIIFQKNRSQWGSYSYKEEFDALRVKASPQSLKQPVETFTVTFDNVSSNSVEMALEWEKTRVPVLIAIDLKKTVVPQLEKSLLGEGRKPYFRAAMFYFENDLDIDRAAELMSLALEGNPKHVGMLYRLGLILEKRGDKKGAIEAAEKSLSEAQSVSPELKSEYTKLNNALLARLRK